MDSRWPQFVGRYEFQKELARGGSSLVALAFDPQLHTHVVLKALNGTQKELRDRFLDEARLLRLVRSPHVVTVHDIGQLDDGRAYFVLDYADRGSLADRALQLSRHIAIDHLDQRLAAGTLHTILRFVDEFADGLDAVHAAGLVHRDLKPANIFIESTRRSSIDSHGGDDHPLLKSDERVLIGDLGIAKDLNKGTSSSTLIGGTPLYLAPEQLESNSQITPSADIFGATAVLWNVLSGKPPPTSHALDSSIALLPSPWKHFFAKGFSANPEERHRNINAWRWDIHELFDAQEITKVFTDRSIQGTSTENCPYKGLNAYQTTDADSFCGREALSVEIHNRLSLHDVLFIGGPSGSGKSSLVRAGLIPMLEAENNVDYHIWDIHVITPGTTPLAELDDVLSQCNANTDDHSRGTLLLVIDQFEEVFTQCSAETRDEFLTVLSELNQRSGLQCKLVIVIRADFYAECARIPWLAGGITNNQVLVGPMTRAELRRAITEPAEVNGYSLEPELLDLILDDVEGEAGSLPLLSHALVETWIRREAKTLSINGYKESGGVMGAISKTADTLYQQQLDDTNRSEVRKLFLTLVTPGHNSPDTRRAVSPQELLKCFDNHDVGQDIINRLTKARLLTVDDNKIQITHEALLREWPKLKNWIEDARQDLLIRERIQFAAQEWQHEKNEDFLYRGSALLNALEWQNNHPGELDEVAMQFVDLSSASEERQRQAEHSKEQRINKTRRILLAAVSLLAMFTTAASIFAYRAFLDAKTNSALASVATQEAEARFATALGSTAYGYADEDPRLSLVLAAESIALTEGHPAEFDARAALLSARWTMSEDTPTLLGSPLPVDDSISISLNPQGTVLAVGSFDGTVSFFDTKTHEPIQPPQRDHSGGIRHVKFSPNGRSLTSACTDNTIMLWQPDEHGIWKSKLVGKTDDVVLKVAYLPDGNSIYSANGDGNLQQWTLDGKAPPAPLARAEDGFTSLAIDPKGEILLATTMDKSYSGWSLLDKKPLFATNENMDTHGIDLTISTDSRWFVYLETGGRPKLGKLPDGTLLDSINDLSAGAARFVATEKGERLILGGTDGRLQVVDPVNGEVKATSAKGHSQSVIYLAVAADANIAATLGRDQQIRFWTINKNYKISQQWQQQKPRALAVNPAQNQIATANKQGDIKILTTDDTTPVREFSASNSEIWAASYSSDGNMLATGDSKGEIRIWTPDTGRMLRGLESQGTVIWSLAFSKDMKYLWSATDTSVIRWSLSDGSQTVALNQDSSKITRFALSETAGLIAASQSDGQVIVRKSENFEPVAQLTVDDDLIWSVVFNTDGTLLAAASGSETVSIYSMPDGVLLHRLSGHFSGATDVEFLNDNATLVVSDRKGNLHWWDLITGRRLTSPWSAHDKTIWRLAKLPDGMQIAATGDDNKVSVWNAFSLKNACEIGLSGFDRKMHNQYIGEQRQLVACQTPTGSQ